MVVSALIGQREASVIDPWPHVAFLRCLVRVPISGGIWIWSSSPLDEDCVFAKWKASSVISYRMFVSCNLLGWILHAMGYMSPWLPTRLVAGHGAWYYWLFEKVRKSMFADPEQHFVPAASLLILMRD